MRIPVPRTLADGAQTPNLGALTFALIRSLVADVVTVSDAALVEAMRFVAERMRIVVEPTGCLAAAAAFTGAVDCRDKRVGIILSGGNVDMALRQAHRGTRHSRPCGSQSAPSLVRT